MSEAHRRKKAPEQIRRAILAGAARLSAEAGISALSVQAVASAAGITKGGFFHHFPSKQAMVEALFAELIGGFDRAIDAELAKAPPAPVCFTRAYVAAIFGCGDAPGGEPPLPFSLSMLTDPAMNKCWADWFAARQARHADTDAGPDLEIVRLAADGFWLAGVCNTPVGDAEAIRARLISATRPRGSP